MTKYYYHGGKRVAMRVDESGESEVYYLHGDHLGSTSLSTDENGGMVARQLYHPYGTTRYSEGTLATDFGFTGQRKDSSTGLVFMHARYYHPALGRFVSADTIVPGTGSQGRNRYMYVEGNPVQYTDPSGHNGVPWWAGAMAAAAESLHSIADPARNPRTAAFHNSFWEGVEAWGDVGHAYAATVDYTAAAISEGDWEGAARGVKGLAQENWEIAKAGGKAAGQLVWGAVTTPVRIFASDIPEFTGAVSERVQGQGREWDVLFTAATLAGDATSLYYMTGARAQHAQNEGTLTYNTQNEGTPTRIYSARELIRSVEEPGPYHNFPGSFDEVIFAGDRTVMSDNYILYTQEGTINGHPGVYEIGVRPSSSGGTEVITHRFFRPTP
ncbi:MAG: RHS repeat-associated core domain-containing protein [Aestuariibacter sp.]|nr:RHS repeat-associated core domain-containing protein [Aestuariibacter sp.]